MNEYDNLLSEAKRCARTARGLAGVMQGIPIYMSAYFTLDSIARDLDRAVEKVERSQEKTA